MLDLLAQPLPAVAEVVETATLVVVHVTETREAFSHYSVVQTPYGPSRVPKAIHLTEEDAMTEAERLGRVTKWGHHAYQCRVCGWYHIGSARNYVRLDL